MKDMVTEELASRDAWAKAKDAVKPGMTWYELYGLDKRLATGGRQRTMQSAYGTDKWIYLDADHMAIHLQNDVVTTVHR